MGKLLRYRPLTRRRCRFLRLLSLGGEVRSLTIGNLPGWRQVRLAGLVGRSPFRVAEGSSGPPRPCGQVADKVSSLRSRGELDTSLLASHRRPRSMASSSSSCRTRASASRCCSTTTSSSAQARTRSRTQRPGPSPTKPAKEEDHLDPTT